MNIIITRVAPGYYLPGRGWRKGAIFACVDGTDVALLENKGWVCRCSDAHDCEHISTVLQLIAPATVAKIEAGRPTT